MRLFSYIVARDYGFAPNPFYGWCTLATCKPIIRGSANIRDWIIGTGAKTNYNLAGHLIFAMQVSETLSFDDYWTDSRFACKKPILNGSLKQVYGDNIYHRDCEIWTQADSHHSLEGGLPNDRNIGRDTNTDRVLVANRFVYFGASAPAIPGAFRSCSPSGKDLCCQRQGHQILSEQVTAEFGRWLESCGKWGLQGLPCEFRDHPRRKGTGNRV